MNSSAIRVDLGAYSVEVSPEWKDVTETLQGEARPWTLEKLGGIGALQFSRGRYNRESSALTLQALAEMVREFGRKRGLGEPTEVLSETEPMFIAGGTYCWDQSYFRLWYVSDGRAFVFVTYTAGAEHEPSEIPACEQMVRSIRW